MTCRSPDVRTLVSAPATLESSVTAEDADGSPLRLTTPWYLVHPDEAFDVTDSDTALTVHARGLAVGHAAENVVNRSTVTGRRACRVTAVTGRQIACVSVDGAPWPADVRAVTVTVGNTLQCVVTRRTAAPEDDDNSGGEGLTFVRVLCHVLRTVFRVTVIASWCSSENNNLITGNRKALASATRADNETMKNICSTLTNCMTCTTVALDDAYYGGEDYEGACWWSSKRQACLQPMPSYSDADSDKTATESAEEVLVHDPADCPHLWMVDGGRAYTGEPFAYRVNVTNDAVAGLVAYMGRVGVTCYTDDGGRLAGRAVANAAGDGGHIACDPVTITRHSSDDRPWSASVGHYYVVFGPHNATLRLEHEMDYYVTFYDRDCSTVGNEGDGGYVNGCVDCAWTAQDYRYYVKRCSTRNQCVGPFEYYDRRYIHEIDTHVTSWVNSERTECEQAITIESFEPTHVPWTTTEVNMSMVIRNHRILVKGATMNVTVAGRACENPETSSEEEDTVTCTVRTDASLVAAAVGEEGPVRVVYTVGCDLTVESAKTFRFVVPRVTGPFCGPLSGGTRLTVSGIGLADAPSLNVSVQWADGVEVPCHVVRKTSDVVDCSTAPVPSPTGRGHVRVDADGRWSLLVKDHGFEYVNTSRPVDGGRRLSGIASGGTSVTVHQDWPGCAQHVWFRVFSVSSWIKCRARHGAFECRSPKYADDGAGGEARGGTNGRGPGNESAPVALLKCDFVVAFFGVREYRDFVKRPCPEEGYAVYADPAFEDFVVGDDGQVTVYGRGRLGLGFGASDVSVRFGDLSAGPCIVLDVRPDRIVCAADVRTAERLVAGDLHEVLVKVGDAANVTVPRRRHASSVPDESDRLTKAWLLLPLLLGFVVLSWWWLKKRKAVTRYRSAVQLSDLSTEH